jgi:hypothetical protein
VRKLLPSLPFVGVLLMFWACAYQHTCERDLARAQGKAGGREAATMPTTAPSCFDGALDEGDEIGDVGR